MYRSSNNDLSTIPDTTPAINASYIGIVGVGGTNNLEESVLRQNFMARLKKTIYNKDNTSGVSSGGASYVPCLYDPINEDMKNPYACGGMKKYKDAYGSSNKHCVVNLDEY